MGRIEHQSLGKFPAKVHLERSDISASGVRIRTGVRISTNAAV
jgi:hypothetical protein